MKSFFSGLFKQKNIKYFVAAGILIILGLAYLWYANNYGNKKQVELDSQVRVDYDKQNDASQYNLTADYIWSRTKSVMLSSDKIIPEYYMIQGQLTDETPEYSERYLLTDQALLLSLYVRQNDRISAMSLTDEVYQRFQSSQDNILSSESGKDIISIHDNMVWLDSFLEYYSVFGSTSDYEKIQSAVSSLFDEKGNIVNSELSYETLQRNEINTVEGDALVDYSATSATENGVELRSVNLRLIRNLESNQFIPSGSYERALECVKGGIPSDDIPFYAYAYVIQDDGSVTYIYEGQESGAMDIAYSIETALHMADVGEISPSVYAYLKKEILNARSLGNSYNLLASQASGEVSLYSYIQCLNIAIDCDDEALYSALCEIIGNKVATYKNSPILSMLFRNDGYRYITYAQDNLLIYLLLT